MLDHLSPRKTLLLSLLIMLLAVASKSLDQIPLLAAAELPNPDSYYKLALLHDYVPTTGFQYMARDNAPYGSYLHWSAVHSWTLLKLAQGFMSFGLDRDHALLWAGGGLTLLSMLLLTAFVAGAVIGQGGRLAAAAAALVLATSIPLLGYGQLLQITHHIFMLVPLAVAACCFLRRTGLSACGAGVDWLGGVMLALALWISPETMPMVVALAAVRAAMRMQYRGAPVWPVAVGLVVMLAWGWHVDPPPPTFGAWALDHVSLAWLLLAGLLAALLVLTDLLAWRRMAVLPALSMLGLALLLMTGLWLHAVPGALAGPDGLIPDELKSTWWAHIGELGSVRTPAQWVAYLLMPSIAGLVLAHTAWRERSLWMAVLAMTVLIYAVFGGWHMRMGGAAAFMAALAYGVALARQPAFAQVLLSQMSFREQSRAAWLILLPVFQVCVVMGLAVCQPDAKSDGADECRLADISSQLNQLPPGVVLVSINEGPEVLWRTHHRIIAGNYHHNLSGIADLFSLWRSTPPDTMAREVMTRRQVAYVLGCSHLRVAPQDQSTLLGRVSSGQVVDWLPHRERMGSWWLYERGTGMGRGQP